MSGNRLLLLMRRVSIDHVMPDLEIVSQLINHGHFERTREILIY